MNGKLLIERPKQTRENPLTPLAPKCISPGNEPSLSGNVTFPTSGLLHCYPETLMPGGESCLAPHEETARQFQMQFPSSEQPQKSLCGIQWRFLLSPLTCEPPMGSQLVPLGHWMPGKGGLGTEAASGFSQYSSDRKARFYQVL